MPASKSWIVVLDGARARFFEKAGARGRMTERDDLAMESERKASRDMGRDKPARTFDSSGGQRHAIEPRTDLHDEAEKAFVRQVVQAIETGAASGSFEKLVLIAAPRALGVLRASLPSRLIMTVAGEISKDMTRSSLAKIDELVAERGLV